MNISSTLREVYPYNFFGNLNKIGIKPEKSPLKINVINGAVLSLGRESKI